MERLRSILHEQGREIDQLKMENLDQQKRIKNLDISNIMLSNRQVKSLLEIYYS